MEEQSHPILLLEDEDADVFLMQRAFSKNGIKNPLIILRDGQEGIEYMQGKGKFEDRALYPLPKVIILDLKMPRKNGLEFLSWMRDHPHLRVIPTILLSSSREDSDVAKAYDLGVNTYFVKPGNYQQLVKLVRTMHDYWADAVKPKEPKIS
jgi:CheY-like chemotaxis protein